VVVAGVLNTEAQSRIKEGLTFLQMHQHLMFMLKALLKDPKEEKVLSNQIYKLSWMESLER